uniref:SCP domain-containing protein n=1 Tax=Panagrolaimus sp. PS1159 TaxID=55785 RepID=A0AC35F473_9BILA
MHFRYDVADYDAFLETGLSNQQQYGGSFGLTSSLFLARSPVYTGIQRLDIYNSNASTVGCAMYDCDIATKYGNSYLGNFTTQIMCSVDPKVQFGEEIYEVASSATNYIPPSEDVICQDGIFVIQHRETIMAKINEIRSKIADGTYELQNGEIALKVWSCDEEAAIGATLSSLSCDNTLYDSATEFHKIVHQTTMWIKIDDINGFVDQIINEFFVSNSNFNFLSTSSIYSTQYPAAFALSDQATSFACNAKPCFQNGSIDWHFVCRAKPEIQNNTPLYQI